MINFTPIGKKFLVKQIQAPTTSVGGIIITTKQNQDLYEAEVVQIGSGYKDEQAPLEIGNRVILTKWVKHDELKTSTENFMVIDTDSVVVVLRD